MTATKYSLNLSPRYAPSWGAWEVAREVICNAMDASPDHMRIKHDGDNRLMVWTPTAPSLDQLFVIGQGSKNPGGSTIGQFGEGLKMAALTATRATDAQMRIDIPGHSITFEFGEVFGSEVLHAVVTPRQTGEGCKVSIDMPGVGKVYQGRILDDRTNGPRPRSTSGTNIFCKGVFIKNEEWQSLWDWNLNDIAINRDRSMAEDWSILHGIAAALPTMRNEDLRAIISNPESIEATRVMDWVPCGGGVTRRLASEFASIYGDKAVLPGEDHKHNAIARRDGFTVVTGLGENLMKRLASGGAPTASSIMAKNADLESVDIAPYQTKIGWLRQLDLMTAAPHFSISVFSNRDEKLKGRADIEELRMWLSSGLFTPGNELELVRTYLHESAHLMSGDGDATLGFEHALEGIAGRLAMTVLRAVDAPSSEVGR